MEFDIFGTGSATSGSHRTVEEVIEQARLIEELGFRTIWGSDHQYNLLDRFAPQLDRYILMTAIAMATSRVRLGSLVTGNTYRHPVVLAKMVTTLDVVSNGRAELGIGAGWTKPEHEAYGIRFPPFAERIARLDETLMMLQRLWTEREASFEGTYHRLENAPCEPKPVQKPHPPRIVGGSSESLLRVVARNAEEWSAGMGSPYFLEGKTKLFGRCCAEVGRDPATVRRSTLLPVKFIDDSEALERYREDYLAAERRRIARGHSQKIKWVGPDEDPWDAIWAMMLVGTSQQVIDGIRRLRDIGFTRIIFNTEDSDSIRRLAREIVPAFS